MSTKRLYANIAKHISRLSGRPGTFLLAVGVILLWVVTGPLFGFSDTWQLVINTGTTIITFLMVFLIQNTQNRDTEALQIKLDELNPEAMAEQQLDRLHAHYESLARLAREDGENPLD